jgi:hypothetical protein
MKVKCSKQVRVCCAGRKDQHNVLVNERLLKNKLNVYQNLYLVTGWFLIRVPISEQLLKKFL